MDSGNSKKASFNKSLFCLYQSTSDDLMFWCWFDVLILSMNFGLSMTQISLVFSVSFWLALVMQMPGNYLAKKLGAGRSVLLSAFLFLAAALFLTFGHTIVMAIAGQSVYLIAMTFQELSTVIVKNAARKDPEHVDYISVMSMTGALFSAITLIAALFMTRLFEINQNLPMYICVGFCLNSCFLAYFVSRYDTGDEGEGSENRREVLPGGIIHSFDKTTLSCLFLSVLFIAIFEVSGNNLKIMIQDDLYSVVGRSRTVFLFSMILLASRLVKVLSNLLLGASRNRNNNITKEKSFFLVVLGTILFSFLGVWNEWETGYYAIILVVAAFLIRVMVYDPFRFSIYDFMLKRLKDDKMIDVLFVHSIGSDLFTALFSTLSTILLSFRGLHSVMLMLLILSMVLGLAYLINRRYLIRVKGNRNYNKWKEEEIVSSDDLMMAAAVLLMHYGVVQDASYTPTKLLKKVSSVENISAVSPRIGFEGFCDYNEETIKRMFYTGHPCAVKAIPAEGEPEYWLPVLYLDDDGGLVWNPYSEERFLVHFYRISQICSFTITS